MQFRGFSIDKNKNIKKIIVTEVTGPGKTIFLC